MPKGAVGMFQRARPPRIIGRHLLKRKICFGINKVVTWNSRVSVKVLSTLIRFQTKTELFCSVLKKICVHTYRFRIVFAPGLHYNADQEKSHTVEWSGALSCLFWWLHRFQIASFSPSTLENSVFKKHRFQIAPLWRAFSNGSIFVDRFRRCSVDDNCIRSKTAPFSFENGGRGLRIISGVLLCAALN